MSNRLSDAIYMTKRVVARHPNVDLATPYPRKLAFDGGEHMVIVKLGVQTGRHVALDRLYITLIASWRSSPDPVSLRLRDSSE